jgi:hypothetical protein
MSERDEDVPTRSLSCRVWSTNDRKPGTLSARMWCTSDPRPNSLSARAWSTSPARDRFTPKEAARRARLHADNIHPVTKRFSASWKPAPTGDPRAQARSRWRPGSQRAKKAGGKRSYFKTVAARVNAAKGGKSRSSRKGEAARINGRKGGRPRTMTTPGAR